MRSRVKIDWDTVELVTTSPEVVDHALDHASASTSLSFPDRRGRSAVKKILSGAAARARARGAIYTHTQLRKRIPAGLETLIYSWWLVVAAMESQKDFSRGVEVASQAISATSKHIVQLS